MNHKIPNDLENWVSEKALAAFKKRIPDIEELETYLRKWKMSLCMENAVVKNIGNIGVRPQCGQLKPRMLKIQRFWAYILDFFI